jgi:hypothetical protein
MKPLIGLVAAALLVSGCGAAAANGGSATPAPPDSPVSHDVDPSAPPVDGGPAVVTPVPGDSRGWPVLPAGLRVFMRDDGHAVARVRWYGGVDTCYVLGPVRVVRRAATIRLRLFEASSVPADTACIDLAMLKAVDVDLGALEPGSYTVAAGKLKRSLTVPA